MFGFNPPWPMWRDGWPVKVGETAMSLIGPLRASSRFGT